MKQLYAHPTMLANRKTLAASLILLWLHSVPNAVAQEGSQGNATIFAGAQATFFDNHNFISSPASPGTQPGIIGTERTTSGVGTGYGVLNFSVSTLIVTGADDANHVDGYVRNLGAGLFVYPVGDNGFYGPFAASAAGVTGAYFHTNATTAITSKLGGGNYPILPVTPGGTAFPTTSKSSLLKTVSTVEYWDIDGANSSALTLTWDAGSNVSALTSATISRLVIAGWNPTTNQWVKIPSARDVTSVLGGPSNFTAGSITTTANIVPNTYTIYTLAALSPDLTPTLRITPAQIVDNNKTINMRVVVGEINGVETNGNIFVTIPVSAHYVINPYNSSQTTSTGLPVQNTRWSYLGISGSNYVFQFGGTAGATTILGSASSAFGFSVVYSANSQTGTENVVVSIFNGAGGEINFTNNKDNENINFSSTN